MKLYRRHSSAFQKQIEEAGGTFINDAGRWGNTHSAAGVMNQAGLYTYYAELETTRLGVALGDEPETNIYEYEVEDSIKLLDLRLPEHRALAKNYIAYSVEESKTRLEEFVSFNQRVGEEKVNRMLLSRKPNMMRPATEDIVINMGESFISTTNAGGGYWGEECIEHAGGVALKKDIIELGFDGVIAYTMHRGEMVIALLNPAKLVACLGSRYEYKCKSYNDRKQ